MSLTLLALLLAAPPETYALDPAGSHVLVQVEKAGLLAFAGHAHEVEAPLTEGQVHVDAQHPATSSVQLRFAAAGLRVTGRGEPAGDVPKVQARMAGPEVLDADRFPEIRFRSTAVQATPAGPSAWRLVLRGELELRGARGTLELPLSVSLVGDELRARGRARLRQTTFGLRPISVAGLVKVRDELLIEIDVLAWRVAPDGLRPR